MELPGDMPASRERKHRPSHFLSGGDLKKSCVIAPSSDVEMELKLEPYRQVLPYRSLLLNKCYSGYRTGTVDI